MKEPTYRGPASRRRSWLPPLIWKEPGTSATWNYRATSRRQRGHSSCSPESARAETISLGRSSHRVGGVGRGRLPPRACRRDDGRPSTRRLLGETPVSLEVHRLVALR